MDEEHLNKRRTHWLSQPFADLIIKLRDQKDFCFDVVIIGSGYGGAIAAAELAGCTDSNGKSISVCVLERGEEYLPGSFPSRTSDLPGHIRYSSPNSKKPEGQANGLFDYRIGKGMNTLVANGLGGGSLINAAVMEIPTDDIFDSHWPSPLQDGNALRPYYLEAKYLLGAADKQGHDNTVNRHAKHQQKPLAKYQSLKDIGKDQFRPAAITVGMQDDDISSANVRLNACHLCGDCATGCNHGAKNSLDINLLKTAKDKGAEIYTGVTVLNFMQDKHQWLIRANYTDEKLALRQGQAVTIKTQKLILAAGTLGSTELMLKAKQSQQEQFQISTRLGQGFSSNGDMIAVGYAQKNDVNAVADETIAYDQREVGPTITGIIDAKSSPNEEPLIIEEMAVPGGLKRIFTELYTTVNSLHTLEKGDFSRHKNGYPESDPFAIHHTDIYRTAIYAIIGRDSGDGKLRLPSSNHYVNCEGLTYVDWPDLKDQPVFDKQIETLQSLLKAAKAGGRVLPNPAWKLLPEGLNGVLGDERGSLLTVHPLGGCAMADTIQQGVVNERGQVFKKSEHSDTCVFDSLVILDGAIIPTALGTNPALSIAAVSLRAIRLLKQQWGLNNTFNSPALVTSRPVYWQPKQPEKPIATEIELIERTSSLLTLSNRRGEKTEYRVELTLEFDQKVLLDIVTADSNGRLKDPNFRVNGSKSFLRIINDNIYQTLLAETSTHEELESALDKHAVLKTSLSGELRILARSTSNALTRSASSLPAWFLNRGLRDYFQNKNINNNKQNILQVLNEALSVFKLATQAGEQRLFSYDLSIGQLDSSHPFSHFSQKSIKGVKRIRYERRSNPWKQMMLMELTEFPTWLATRPVTLFELDLRFLGRIRIPLFHIVKHDNEVNSLFDLMSFLSYFFRLLLHIHFWSFRKPERQRPRQIERLPGYVPGLPAPEIVYIDVVNKQLTSDKHHKNALRLTHYNRNTRLPASQHRSAIVMLHGYSASGTTYAHPALKPGLAKFLWEKGHDIWIVDFRSSCGMPGAQVAWSFEDIAHHDIPTAFEYIFQRNDHNPFDVVAHCMGSAMFSMAALNNTDNHFGSITEQTHRLSIGEMVRRVVLSQVGPHVIFTPINVFRSYVSSYLRHYLPFKSYEFRPSDTLNGGAQILDRLLYSLPYPTDEFDREHPWSHLRQPLGFVATRRRMDALYGRAFNLKGMHPDVLLTIDDFFGPLNMDTVAQVIQFTRYRTVTNRNGLNCYTSADKINSCWNFPTLSIHGKHNGLADVLTTARVNALMKTHGKQYSYEIAECGHQDSLIGSSLETLKLFHRIEQFLHTEMHTHNTHKCDLAHQYHFIVDIPWAGPILGPGDKEITLPTDTVKNSGKSTNIHVMAGGNPLHGCPQYVVYVAVKKTGNYFYPLFSDCFTAGDNSLSTLDDVIVIRTYTGDEANWCRHTVPTALMHQDADGVLQLMLYSQHTQSTSLLQFLQANPAMHGVLRASFQHEDLAVRNCCQQVFEALIRFLKEKDVRYLLPTLLEFPTLKPENSSSVCFAVGSCQYPPGILYPDKGVDSYHALNQILDDEHSKLKPEFLILTGDQVYVDATAGLFDPTNSDDKYVPQYLRQYHRMELRHTFRRLCTYTMLDDHEIDNDWEPIENTNYKSDAIEQGKRHYLNYQRHVAPMIPDDPSVVSVPLWYQFNRCGLDFFMLDTRTDRSSRRAETISEASLISEQQFQDLKDWLHSMQNIARPKFIVSSNLPFPRLIKSSGTGQEHHAIYADNWDGYPHTLYRVLKLIYELKIENLIFLSGDEHLSCDARMVISDNAGDNPLTIRSIHSSPLNAPFPFANASVDKFIHNESFCLKDSHSCYKAEITSDWYVGDGFSYITVSQQAPWTVDVVFDGEKTIKLK